MLQILLTRERVLLFSSFGPPNLNQHNGSVIGLMVRKSNLVAHLAQFASGLGIEPCIDGIRASVLLDKFCQLSGGTIPLSYGSSPSA